MNIWVSMILTLACAFVIGALLTRLHVPGGMMLGGIIGAAAFNIVTDQAYTPYVMRLFAQSIAGGFLGATIDRDKIKRLKDLILPLLVIVGTMLCADILIGWLIVRVSPLDPVTALASGMAGGINDVPLIAEELGGDAGKVAVLQFVRLITGIAVIPFLIGLTDKDAHTTEEHEAVKKAASAEISWGEYILTILVAVAGGYIGKLIGIPAGILLFSMIATAILHLATGKGRMRSPVKKLAQLFTGAYIGCMLHKSDVLELRFVILPALVVAVVFIGASYFGAWLMRKVSNFNVRESMLATTPAGASEIALLSEDLNISGKNSADIMILHVFRVICVVSIIPQLIPWIATWIK